MAGIEAKIGFDRVRKAISDRCSTEYAAHRVAEEHFSTDPAEIRHRLLLTDEMRLIVMFEETFPMNGYVDCLPFLGVLAKEGSNIDLTSLGKLRTLLDTMFRITRFFDSVKDGVYPCLTRLASQIRIFPEVVRRISLIIDKYGNVRDSASEELSEIRKAIKEKEGAVSRRITSILKAAQQAGYVEADAGVSVRDGKMLIPVLSAHKRKLGGFVYDESATGKTTYIEPAEVVEIQNEISELHFAETREIARILSEFSDFLRPYVPDIAQGAVAVGEIDFIMAKAQVALDYIAGMPIISESAQMSLRKARHPLLEKALIREGRKVVPLTVTLTPQKHILLISGPNAGGKSVLLQTVGLLQYMFQWGMLIPTSETSEMMVFDRVMVDIGDGQSIDNDLSTYSAFLVSMKEMLREADSKTLVLIDELGSGTEPTAGGAIAEAILSELDRRGVYGVVTTHYTNLKMYASDKDCGVINGAMLFDTQKIEPLFKLEVGLPGSSFAFELARKMGLPEKIVKDAEGRAGEEFVNIERNLRQIARNRKVLDERLQKIRATDRTLENITQRYQKELEDIRQTKKQIIDEARQQAEDIVRSANKQVENTIKTIREANAEKEKTKQARHELQSFVEAISQKKTEEQKKRDDYIESKIQTLQQRQERATNRKGKRTEEDLRKEAERKREEAFRNAPLQVGEKVRIKDNGMVGEVTKLSSRTVTMAVGNVSSTLDKSRVERISSNEYKNAVRETFAPPRQYEDSSLATRKLEFKTETDLRGMRVNEALEAVTRYVDDAIMLGVGCVRIIHGKGTGALREEIQKFLRTVPGVASVKDESVQFGGTGVTIVKFE